MKKVFFHYKPKGILNREKERWFCKCTDIIRSFAQLELAEQQDIQCLTWVKLELLDGERGALERSLEATPKQLLVRSLCKNDCRGED